VKLADLEGRLLFALDGGVDGCAHELADGRPPIAPTPRDGELTGLDADDRTADDPRPRVDADVPFRQERDAVAGCDRFEGLVGRARLGADPDWVSSALLEREPMVPERAGLRGQGHERLLEEVRKLYRPLAGEPMPGGKGDVLSLAAERQDLDHVLGAGGEPDERDVDTPFAETAGRIRPDVRAKFEPPLRAQPRETRCNVLVQTATDARLKTDLKRLLFLVRALSRDG
jgi:hypothetical protein